MTTKQKIVDEALRLFSVKGYKGTSVKNIADAVGIKDASLYKHFRSKQEILDTLVATMHEHIAAMSHTLQLPAGFDIKAAACVYKSFDEEMLVDFSKKIFQFYLKDDVASRFWKMGMIEQYRDPEVGRSFVKLFLEDSITYQTELFREMMAQDIFIQAEPQVVALSFYSPIFFLLTKYSNQQEKGDEALALLEKQVRAFCKIYIRMNAN